MAGPSIYLVLLLSALAYAKIAIHLDLTLEKPLADASGNFSNRISDEERKTFQVEDKELKDAVAVYSKNSPTDVFVRETTRWNGLYVPYGWSEVVRILKPKLEATEDPKCGDPIPFGKTINDAATISSEWENNGTLSVSETSQYEIVCEFATFKFNSLWGKRISEAKDQVLHPRPKWIKKCILEVGVVYVGWLAGDVVANYEAKRDGHYFWAFDIAQLKTPRVIYKENIKIHYYKSASRPTR